MLLNRYLTGWSSIEPAIIACVATNQNMLLIGKHGIAKSTLMKVVGDALSSDEKYRVTKYSMDKENLISMVGIPDSTALKAGKMEYAQHERSIFNADVALFDEITRASKENQNMVLEILEEGTVFGKKLGKLKLKVATANDESYHGAMKLDAALLDRFSVVLPVPHTGSSESQFGPEEIQDMIELNLGGRESSLAESNEAFRATISEISSAYESLWTKQDKDGKYYIRENVIDYCSKLFAQILTNLNEMNKGKKSDKYYISARQISNQFPRLLVAIAAYYKVVKDDADYLKNGAFQAIVYSLSTKLGIPIDKLSPIHESLKELLTDGDAIMGKVQVGITTGSAESRIKTLQQYDNVVRENLDLSEIINSVGNIIQELDVSSDVEKSVSNHNMKLAFQLMKFLEEKDYPKVCLYKVQLLIWQYCAENNFELNIITNELAFIPKSVTVNV